jgi:hypothetical protein
MCYFRDAIPEQSIGSGQEENTYCRMDNRLNMQA